MKYIAPSVEFQDSVDSETLSTNSGTVKGVSRYRHLNTLVKLCTEFSTWREFQNELAIGHKPNLYKGNPFHRELAAELGLTL